MDVVESSVDGTMEASGGAFSMEETTADTDEGFAGGAAVVAGVVFSTDLSVVEVSTEGAADVRGDASTGQVTVDISAGWTTEDGTIVEIQVDFSIVDSMVAGDTVDETYFDGDCCDMTVVGGEVDVGEMTIKDLLMGF